MSHEILSVLEYMEKEKGISREDMISAIVTAIKGAAQKGVNAGQELRIEINPRTGALKAFAEMQVVDSLSDPRNEIHIEKAHLFETPDGSQPQLGGIVLKPLDPAYLGRIAAQTARQAIMQRLRQFEKERIFDEYKDTIGDIVTGVVRRRERGDLVVDLGKAEAILPPRERVPGEDYAPGERIRCLLLEIEQTNRGPELILSRASQQFITRLFELEVAEIADGTVFIAAMAREPGYRTKVAVDTNDPRVDPVGACVGARGARVKSIVRELAGEKVDILRFYPDPLEMLEEAIKPAVARNVRVEEARKTIFFDVSEEDLAVAIGRRGQNARLTSKLLGWRLEIAKEDSGERGFADQVEEAVAAWHGVSGIPTPTAQRLVDVGLVSPEAFEGVEPNDLIDAGFTEEEANEIVARVGEYRASQGSLSQGG